MCRRGTFLYFLESSAHTVLLGETHKYTRLLWISLTVLIGGNLLFWVGGKPRRKMHRWPKAPLPDSEALIVWPSELQAASSAKTLTFSSATKNTAA